MLVKRIAKCVVRKLVAAYNAELLEGETDEMTVEEYCQIEAIVIDYCACRNCQSCG